MKKILLTIGLMLSYASSNYASQDLETNNPKKITKHVIYHNDVHAVLVHTPIVIHEDDVMIRIDNNSIVVNAFDDEAADIVAEGISFTALFPSFLMVAIIDKTTSSYQKSVYSLLHRSYEQN